MGGTSLFPAKREVKREVSKALQAWPGNQTSPRGLVRSLVCVGGRAPAPMCPRRCLMGLQMGAVSVRIASLRGSGGGPGWPAPGGRAPCPEHPPKNRSRKKSPAISSAPSLRKAIPNDGFRFCRGRRKFLSAPFREARGARAKSPAACRGGGGPQCRNAQGFLRFGPL